jgi:hypothetical protein
MAVSVDPTEGLPSDLGEVTVLYVHPDYWNEEWAAHRSPRRRLR